MKTATRFGIGILAAMLGIMCFGQSPTPHGIALTWTASTTSGVTYTVYRAVSASGTCGAFTQIASGITTTAYLDPASGLSASASYCYEVNAVEGSSLSSPSNVATISAATIPVNRAPPSGCTAAVQ